MNDLTTTTAAGTAAPATTYRPSAMMEPVRFDHLAKVARVLADSSCMPASAKGGDAQETYANAFMIANISDRWGVDPFICAQAVSFVHGRMMFEGKLIYAVIQQALGIDLDFDHTYNEKGEAIGIKVTGPRRDGKLVSIVGTLEGWQTKDRSGAVLGQWKHPQSFMQLIYRGAREWCRAYAPGIIVGVYGTDEDFGPETARDITPLKSTAANVREQIQQANSARAAGAGFNGDRIKQQAEDVTPNKEGAPVSNSASSTEGGEDGTSSPSTTTEEKQEGTQTSTSEYKQDAGTDTAEEPTERTDGAEWLRNVASMLWAATYWGEDVKDEDETLRIFVNQKKAAMASHPPEGLPKRVRDKGNSIASRCQDLIRSTIDIDDGKTIIAGLAGMVEEDLDAVKAKVTRASDNAR